MMRFLMRRNIIGAIPIAWYLVRTGKKCKVDEHQIQIVDHVGDQTNEN